MLVWEEEEAAPVRAESVVKATRCIKVPVGGHSLTFSSNCQAASNPPGTEEGRDSPCSISHSDGVRRYYDSVYYRYIPVAAVKGRVCEGEHGNSAEPGRRHKLRNEQTDQRHEEGIRLDPSYEI